MIFLSNDIAFGNIGQEGTGPVSSEAAKSQCAFYSKLSSAVD